MECGERQYDIVLFGATSFVGEIVAERLLERAGSQRIAFAARNQSKLDALKARLSVDVPTLVADAHDEESLREMVCSTRLVVSTVGPYALHGSTLVEFAAASGTDYCDLTGEPQWMQRMIDMHGSTAENTGARLVPACGFDAIPSDVGVLYTQRQALERFGAPCSQISMRVKALKGGASGGTIASMMNIFEEASTDPDVRRVLANPYSLAPTGLREGISQHELRGPMQDEATGSWIAPFVMAPVNTRVVHRSHALLGRPWGEDFLYDEATIAGQGPTGLARATALSAGLAGLSSAARVNKLRGVLADRVLPKPGDGPDQQKRDAGYFTLHFYGTTSAGDTITTAVSGDRDPGYGSTAKMLTEAALLLADLDPADVPGGFWTPATALSERLIERLSSHAGVAFATLD